MIFIRLSPCFPIHDPFTPIRLVSSPPANHSLYSPAFIFLLMPPTLLVMPSLMFLLIQIWPSSKTKTRLSINWILPDHPGLLSIFPSCRYYSVHCLYVPFSNCIISFIKLIFFIPRFSLCKKLCAFVLFYTFWYPLYA